MSEQSEYGGERRRFLKIVGGSALLIPFTGLPGCGGGDAPEPAAPASGTPQVEEDATVDNAAEEPAAEEAPAPAGGTDLERLDEASPQAEALGYVHDASRVDTQKYPRYAEGQVCANCALYMPETGNTDWGGCSIFPGKLVNAGGWCNAYAPRA